jgi:hypothetical protein
MSEQANGRGKLGIQIADGEKLLEESVNKNSSKKGCEDRR